MGYARAGFEVVGVDMDPQPNYPLEFHRADALTFPLDDFDAIHASPPCQAFSLASLWHGHAGRDKHPDLVEPTRQRLLAAGVPFVMENVLGAPIRRDVMLCGEMFGLRVHRHRVFEVERAFVMQPRHAPHRLRGARDNCHIEDGHARMIAGNFRDLDDAKDAMGIDWMRTRHELAESIPPAYTEFIGGQLRKAVCV